MLLNRCDGVNNGLNHQKQLIENTSTPQNQVHVLGIDSGYALPPPVGEIKFCWDKTRRRRSVRDAPVRLM